MADIPSPVPVPGVLSSPAVSTSPAPAPVIPAAVVADGVVEFGGYSGGNGNTVILRHRANFKTMYNHLAGFSRDLDPLKAGLIAAGIPAESIKAEKFG